MLYAVKFLYFAFDEVRPVVKCKVSGSKSKEFFHQNFSRFI